MRGNSVPFATLFGLPFGNAEAIAEGAIVAFGMPVQSASPRRIGTALGPAAIRETSSDALEAYRASPSGTVVDLATGRTRRLRVPDGSLDIGDLELNGQVSMDDIACIAKLTEAIAAQGALPVALGGDLLFSDLLFGSLLGDFLLGSLLSNLLLSHLLSNLLLRSRTTSRGFFSRLLL